MHFRYPNTVGDEALDGIDLTVAPGETVALVGETGRRQVDDREAGRRLLRPDRRARCGSTASTCATSTWARSGASSASCPRRRSCSPGTIRDNIAYGRPDATDAEVEAAARAVGAHDFVAALPGGYLSPVSERGRSLSAGQRQLIALARARLVDPAILLLDEATSQLDLASEARVQQAMSAVAEGRTTLLVAHRLPTARRADRILVIDRGRIVEQGTHDELLALDGEYAELWGAFATTAVAPRRPRRLSELTPLSALGLLLRRDLDADHRQQHDDGRGADEHTVGRRLARAHGHRGHEQREQLDRASAMTRARCVPRPRGRTRPAARRPPPARRRAAPRPSRPASPDRSRAAATRTTPVTSSAAATSQGTAAIAILRMRAIDPPAAGRRLAHHQLERYAVAPLDHRRAERREASPQRLALHLPQPPGDPADLVGRVGRPALGRDLDDPDLVATAAQIADRPDRCARRPAG